jgi:hypothetical protein
MPVDPSPLRPVFDHLPQHVYAFGRGNPAPELAVELAIVLMKTDDAGARVRPSRQVQHRPIVRLKTTFDHDVVFPRLAS